jgi:hypothetical protein
MSQLPKPLPGRLGPGYKKPPASPAPPPRLARAETIPRVVVNVSGHNVKVTVESRHAV